MKLYCQSCNEYTFTLRNTSATVRCKRCNRKLSGRKQREVWKELNDERQGRLEAIEDDMGMTRRQRRIDTHFDD